MSPQCGQGITKQREHSKKKRSAVPLRNIIKKVLIHLYCRGVIPKSFAQNIYNILKLKEL